jgi:hypothetical protein
MQDFAAFNGEKGVHDCVVKLGKLVEIRRASKTLSGEAVELV